MTGPDHYAYAETLLAEAAGEDSGSEAEHYYLSVAQVHATLAHAAATALAAAGRMPIPEYQAWANTCGEPAGEESGNA